MRSRIKRTMAVLAALTAAAFVAAACSSSPSHPTNTGYHNAPPPPVVLMDYAPTVPYLVVAGHTYYPYMTSTEECLLLAPPGTSVADCLLMPLFMPTPTHYTGYASYALAYALFDWHAMYSDYYAGDYYLTHYVPVSYRPAYRQRYIQPFDTKFHDFEVKEHAKAQYTSASTGRTMTGNQVKSNQFGGFRTTAPTTRPSGVVPTQRTATPAAPLPTRTTAPVVPPAVTRTTPPPPPRTTAAPAPAPTRTVVKPKPAPTRRR